MYHGDLRRVLIDLVLRHAESMSASVDVRFAQKAIELLHRSEMTRWAIIVQREPPLFDRSITSSTMASEAHRVLV